ncbi:MAG: hypothetical protein J6B93_04390 [Clostridia bacterium]|nr:hypothetical protein [Clostridia bacterium]
MKSTFKIKLSALLLVVVMLLTGPLYCGTNAFAADSLVDTDIFEDYLKPAVPTTGAQIDPNKSYEYVQSNFFNEAIKELWDMGKRGGFEAFTDIEMGNRTVTNLKYDGSTAGPFIYFWNDKLENYEAGGKRLAYAQLFPGTDPTQYDGLCFWISKPASNKNSKLVIQTGAAHAGYWPSHNGKDENYFSYNVFLPSGDFEGYIYIPFEDIKTTHTQQVLNPTGLNFMGFRYTNANGKVSDLYIDDLCLYREGEGGTTSVGQPSTGKGVQLDSNKEYIYIDSVIFNNATAETWALAKKSCFDVTPGITDVHPDGVKTSVKFHINPLKNSPYPEAYFMNASDPTKNAPIGALFGSGMDFSTYEGLRVWLKSDPNSPHTTFTISIGNMYVGWYGDSKSADFFSYNVVIYKGFEGYVYIPFDRFVNKDGVSIDANRRKALSWIAFRGNDQLTLADNTIYLADLSLYGVKGVAEEPDNTVGVQLDPNKKYELIPSLTFGDAVQKQWDETKKAGIIPTAGITDKEYTPDNGMSSVNLHTDGTVPYAELYYWYENDSTNRLPHSQLWHDITTKDFEGIRFWIKMDENNTYSKLSVMIGSMFTGYWPGETGFFSYDLNIPRGGYEGYVNIPFSAFVNKAGAAYDGHSPNFLAFKYNETAYKVTDVWISDLSIYREAVTVKPTVPGGTVIGGDKLQPTEKPEADGTVTDDMGTDYNEDFFAGQNNGNSSQKPGDAQAEGFNWMLVIIPAAALLVLAAAFIIFFIILKKKKKGNAEQQPQ